MHQIARSSPRNCSEVGHGLALRGRFLKVPLEHQLSAESLISLVNSCCRISSVNSRYRNCTGRFNQQHQPYLPGLPGLPYVCELYRTPRLRQYRSVFCKLFKFNGLWITIMASQDFLKNHFALAAWFGDWPGLVRHLLVGWPSERPASGVLAFQIDQQ